MVEPGWQAQITTLGHLVLERAEQPGRALEERVDYPWGMKEMTPAD